jgi:hypothetical protein
MTCTDFLAGLFSRELESEILTDHLSEEDEDFMPYPTTQSS